MSTFHGALAIVKVRGEAVAKIQNIRVNENINRADVRELGNMIPVESPPVQWSGTVNCSIISVDFESGGIKNALRRDVQTNESYADQLLFNPDGVQIDIFKKIEDVRDPNTGLVSSDVKPYAILKRVLIDSDSFNINEGQVVLRDQTFRFLSPVIYPK